MKRTEFILLFILISFTSITQENSSIDEKMLNAMRTSFNSDGNSKTMINAVSSNDIRKLALNRENLGKVDNYFSHRVESEGITDQKSTGRCWLFTGMNVFRAKVIKEKNLDDFSFSHNFNFFYDQLEKANLFLEGIIATADKPMEDKKVEWLFKNSIGDGGQWTGVVDIISKYGLVPSDVFSESFSSENTRIMSGLIRKKLKEDGLILRTMHSDGKKEKDLKQSKQEMLSDIYRILAISLGEPPTEFYWRYKDKDGNLSELKFYTPKTFFETFVNIKNYYTKDKNHVYYRSEIMVDYDVATFEIFGH